MSRLHLTATAVHGCWVLEPEVFEDVRGFFMEVFNKEDFRRAGLPTEWAQDNQSGSNQNVLRGLHIQRRNPQGKLVRCMRGRLFDVCLDLRRDSPTFGFAHSEVLSGSTSLYCPPGTAHGFLAMEPNSVIYYKCTTLYDKETDGGIYPFSQAIGPIWPLPRDRVTMSEKDMMLPTLDQWLEDNRGVWIG